MNGRGIFCVFRVFRGSWSQCASKIWRWFLSHEPVGRGPWAMGRPRRSKVALGVARDIGSLHEAMTRLIEVVKSCRLKLDQADKTLSEAQAIQERARRSQVAYQREPSPANFKDAVDARLALPRAIAMLELRQLGHSVNQQAIVDALKPVLPHVLRELQEALTEQAVNLRQRELACAIHSGSAEPSESAAVQSLRRTADRCQRKILTIESGDNAANFSWLTSSLTFLAEITGLDDFRL